VRGERQIQAGMIEAQKAAERNKYKKDPRRETLRFWLEKMYEEVEEVEKAIMEAESPRDFERVREEVGDALWSVINAAHHGAMLDLPESGHYLRMVAE